LVDVVWRIIIRQSWCWCSRHRASLTSWEGNRSLQTKSSEERGDIILYCLWPGHTVTVDLKILVPKTDPHNVNMWIWST
jgi:hypothetical protein